jgi:hypothetical protein
MELLVLKSSNDYIRVRAENYHLCRLDKASVFPMEELEKVRIHATILREKGFHSISIARLTLSEEPFESHYIKD